MRESTTERLLAGFLNGDRRACGRVISIVENGDPGARELLHRLYPRTGHAYRIGITGPPGAGKSTLVEKLALACRHQDLKIGIVAVDPTSPFTGGAILGDRVRMSSLFLDPEVFIRSMGSRGSMGGLALQTREVCNALDAFGHDVILIETIGVGQVELDIAQAAFTTVVVLVPESGDSIQAMKAGLMEVGDVFAINKSDREGADRMAMEVSAVLEMRSSSDGWTPCVIRTAATRGDGIDDLLAGIWQHRKHLTETQAFDRLRQETARHEISGLLDAHLSSEFWGMEPVQQAIEDWSARVARREATPYEAAEKIWQVGRKH